MADVTTSKLPFFVEALRRFVWYSSAGVGLDELDLDPGLLLEQLRRSTAPAFGPTASRTAAGEVERLHDERVGCRAVLRHLAQRRDRAPLLGVERVLVALGTGEAHRAAVHAVGQAFLERRLARRRAAAVRLRRRRAAGAGGSRGSLGRWRRRGLVASPPHAASRSAKLVAPAPATQRRARVIGLRQQLLTGQRAPSSSPASPSSSPPPRRYTGRSSAAAEHFLTALETISHPVPVSRQRAPNTGGMGTVYQVRAPCCPARNGSAVGTS